MSNFRAFDRETGFLLPPSLDDWLPERHLARFVVEVIDGLDLSAMVTSSIEAPARRGLVVGTAGFTAMRRGYFRAASWSVRLMIRWRSDSSLRTIILTEGGGDRQEARRQATGAAGGRAAAH